ncbi:YtxH domain-containing protein [Candidatus Peregrinibacteria bacterium]|nr:YtxH domain-containing protein [Candidatus Peregrinibacteria bacterium]
MFRILTGVIVGSAIGSILGLTLAPKKGAETRKYIKDKSMEIFLRSKEAMKNKENDMGFFKRLVVKLLTRKK